ncbi:MAG TPA: hypothetical protein VMT82_03495 [candidate division Zixibacteria bacterium]|nr:hypothetical protein [candidate division Zixibacteria bacterium]
MTEVRVTTDELSARISSMEAAQLQNLRRCAFLLIYFTVAFACLAWERLKQFRLSLEVLPLATVVVICVWVYCVAKHARELSRLRRLLEASDTSATVDGVTAPASETEQNSAAHHQEPAAGV